MATANNPENKQPQGGAADLGQISRKPINFPQWVLVKDPGTDNESIEDDFWELREAAIALVKNYDESEAVDIMKRLEDGTLTTEF